ncbi:MAG: hypothetical protein WBC87_12925, partial [Pseudolabrys sp.]
YGPTSEALASVGVEHPLEELRKLILGLKTMDGPVPPHSYRGLAVKLDPRLAKVKECVSELPSAKCYTLPECDHFDALVRSDLVIPHIKAFLSKVGP